MSILTPADIRNSVIIADVYDGLRMMPDASVHTVVTSPPYYGLRGYDIEPTIIGGTLGCEHDFSMQIVPDGYRKTDTKPGPLQSLGTQGRDKFISHVCVLCGAWRGQLGHEGTPQEFCAHLAAVFSEVRRILRPEGVLWLNIGDSYSKRTEEPWGVPWMLAQAMRAEGWRLRADVIWAKKNPTPESIKTRPTRSHEHLFMFVKSRKNDYFYDWWAVVEKRRTRWPAKIAGQPALERPTLALKRDVWSVASQPYKKAHFACFPPALITPCIKSSASEHGCCAACGAPYVRMMEVIGETNRWAKDGEWRRRNDETGRPGSGQGVGCTLPKGAAGNLAPRKTVGWSPTCGCEAPIVPCIVFDPFMGSGTTAQTAAALGRDYAGIEKGEGYSKLITERFTDAKEGKDGLFAPAPPRLIA